MGDSASSGVDAVTSASLLVPGNAARIAQWIQERTGGDLFSIQVEEPYPDNYDDCLTRAADEKAENARPGLAASVEDIMEALPDDCTVVDNVLGVYRAEVMDAKDDVEAWLEEIGY